MADWPDVGGLVGEYFREDDESGYLSSSGYRTTRVFSCPNCGALVADVSIHDKWHEVQS